MDAVGGADLRGGVGEEHIVVAAVHADGNALFLGVLALGGDDIGEALGGPADDMDVHLVQTDFHGAAQTGGAELQRAVEAVFDLLFVTGDALQLRVLGGGEGVAVEPALVFLFIAHIGTPFRMICTYSSSSTGWAVSSSFASSRREAGTYRLTPKPEKPLMTLPAPPSRS